MATPRAKKPTPARSPDPRPGGISDAAVLKATGRDREHWFAALDRFDVKAKGHKAAAARMKTYWGGSLDGLRAMLES